jgi:hypothetical protein
MTAALRQESQAQALTFGEGPGLRVDLDKLVESRVLIQANSGGGKSWLLRALLEQTFGRVLHLVFDPEGEFSTLRERYGYILAAKHGGDVEASPHTAAMLVRRLMELNVPAVFDLYDLSRDEKREFLKRALNELMNLPRELWRPVIAAVDEIHDFAPESGHGEAQSLEAVRDAAARGRKRMVCLVGATQRMGKLSKDVAAELNNKFVGRTGLDLDVKRAAAELGMNAKDAVNILRSLEPGDFYAYGPAISTKVVLVHGPTPHTRPPKVGSASSGPPPAPEKVKAVLAQLADLPKEARERAQTMEALQQENRELRRQLKATPAPKVERVEVPVLKESDIKRLEKIGNDCLLAAAEAESAAKQIRETIGYAKAQRGGEGIRAAPRFPADDPAHPPRQAGGGHPAPRVVEPTQPTQEGITGPMQRILNALASFESLGLKTSKRGNVAVMANQSSTSSGYANNLGRLRTMGLITYPNDGEVALTDDGRGLAVGEEIHGVADLHAAWERKLTKPQWAIVQNLIVSYPSYVDRIELAERSDQSATSSGYANNLGGLRSLGLIEYPEKGLVRAGRILFLDGR